MDLKVFETARIYFGGRIRRVIGFMRTKMIWKPDDFKNI